jgi:predicted unusual protein kinase regulating ubiquinone biosynthesis (AarF/ABC1/UbiB family)
MDRINTMQKIKKIHKTIYNISFLLQTIFIFFTEIGFYFYTRNFNLFIKQFAKRLASINILYVKVFQSIALHNSIIDDKTNNELLKFADNAPFTKDDIDYDTLIKLCIDNDIVFKNGFDNPINSGMISLVYLARYNHNDCNNSIVIKIKRKNIEKKLEEGIDNVMFFLNLLKIIPFFNNYKITQIISDNIDIIKEQTNFGKEISNIKRMQKNCINIKYIKIPYVYDNINENYTNIIAMEYICGKKFNQIDEEDYVEFAKQVIKFGILTSFIHGFSHGDLHVGNILFIKENSHNDKKPIYKLGIIDFGIMTEIGEHFKSSLLNSLTSVFQDSSIVFLDKFINSGIFEPCIIKDYLPKHVYDNIIQSNMQLLDKFLYSKNLSQIHLYEFIKIFFGFITNSTSSSTSSINNYSLLQYGIRPSDEFIKIQLSLAMANGVTFALCKEKIFEITNEVVNELFHTALFMEK